MVVFSFSFSDGTHPFRANLVKKKQNCQFTLKFSTQPSSNMQNSMMVFTFSILVGKHPFQANLVKENKMCQFKLKSNDLAKFFYLA